MSRGYRGAILTLVGWLILAASPHKDGEAGRDQGDSYQTAQYGLRNTVATIENANKAPERDTGCKAGQDDRSSDLCAQWKAADAADNSAWWGRATFWLGLLGTIIGAGTLLAAGYAAWYARKAAEHTEAGANEARRAADAADRAIQENWKSQRAWMSYGQIKTETFFNANGTAIVGFAFNVAWRNSGTTPALHAQCVTESIGFSSREEAEKHIFPDRLDGTDFFGIIGPGVEVSSVATAPPEHLLAHKAGGCVLIRSVFRYNDIFTNEPRETVATFISHATQDLTTMTPANFNGAPIGFQPFGNQPDPK